MLDIAKGESTPRVLMDPKKKKYIIEGHSYPENSNSFYKPVINWLKEYVTDDEAEIMLKLRLLYLNTSSTKAIIHMLDLLEEAHRKGRKIKIKWEYNEDNEMAKETGEELLEDLTLPYDLVEI